MNFKDCTVGVFLTNKKIVNNRLKAYWLTRFAGLILDCHGKATSKGAELFIRSFQAHDFRVLAWQLMPGARRPSVDGALCVYDNLYQLPISLRFNLLQSVMNGPAENLPQRVELAKLALKLPKGLDQPVS